jgi:integrase
VNAPTLPLRAGEITMAQLIDLYMAHYAGRDTTRVTRLTWWAGKIGALRLDQVSDDHIHAAIEGLGQQSARYFAGLDAEGKPIHKSRGRAVSGATQNRYTAAIGSVFSFAVKRRIAPKGFIHPCRAIERRPESAGKTRFLSDDERERLLAACKASPWPRLYLLVLLAVTTGARRGELLALRWGDVDLVRSEAQVLRSKNGDCKVLPLVPAAVEELKRFMAGATSLVFASTRRPDQAYNFELRWQAALKAAKVKNCRFHDLRHTAASMLARNGATLLEIGDLLGHRTVEMSKRYSHLANGHKAALVQRVFGAIK